MKGGSLAIRYLYSLSLTSVVGLILAALFGIIGLFSVVLGGFTVLANPVIWSLIVWDNRSDE